MDKVKARLDLPRTVLHVVHDHKAGLWLVKWAGQVVDVSVWKAPLVLRCRLLLRRHWREFGIRGQMIVHSKDGQFGFENTYGNDPKESRG